MNRDTLVRELFDGPIDIFGDVHGETEAFQQLLHQLGYDQQGRHPQGRRLVFVGDLGDRGPDSPGMIEWIRDRVLEGRAQSVLGNHDLNALEAAAGGEMKTELSWLFDEARPYCFHGHPVPMVQARGQRREDLLAFLATLPIVLERGGDDPVRIVHACWDTAMVNRLRGERDAVAVYRREHDALQRSLEATGGLEDPVAVKLLHQNCNPVKRLTSGLEGRSSKPILINDEPRWELRLPWWKDYNDSVLCIVGHYWRIALPGENKFESLFEGLPLQATHGSGPVLCIDYSVGKRFRERMHPSFHGRFLTRLGALRLPEKLLYFDNAEPLPLLYHAGQTAQPA